MTEPVVESITESIGIVSDVTVDMPATRPDDDLYVMVVDRDDDDFAYDDIEGQGWTLIEHHAMALGSATASWWWKIGSSEPAQYVLGIDGGGAEKSNHVVIRISGINTSDPIGAFGTMNDGTTSPATSPAITAETADSLILRHYAVDTQIVDSFSGGTEVARITSQAGGTSNYGVVRESSPGASTTTGTATATLSADDDWYANTIEILAAGGPTDEYVPTLAQRIVRHTGRF